MAGIQAVVFDLYGTLIYLSTRTQPYASLFLDLGLRTAQEIRDARRIVLTQDFDDLAGLVKRLKPDAQIDLAPYQRALMKEVASATLYPETTRVLDELRNRGIRLGLISNLASPYKAPFFLLGLTEYFDRALFSCEVGEEKRESRIFHRMSKEIDVPPAGILMVGDTKRDDYDAPRSAGWNVVLLDRKGGSEGSIATLEGVLQYL